MVLFFIPMIGQSFAQVNDTNNIIPNSMDSILSKINAYVQKLVGSSNITSSSNPIGFSSDKLKILQSTWYDTAKQLFGLTKSINNSTTTTINTLSPVKLSSTILWILGIVITLYIVFIFVKKFWRHVFYLIMLMILVIIFLITLGVHNIANTPTP